jgi:hypothetical protein
MEADSAAATLRETLRGPVLVARVRCAMRLTPGVGSRSFATRSASYGSAGKCLDGVRRDRRVDFAMLRLPGPHRLEAQDIALSRR